VKAADAYVHPCLSDIGLALDSAAHVVELIRTRQGAFALASYIAEQDETTRNGLIAAVPWSSEHVVLLDADFNLLSLCFSLRKRVVRA
jgi:tRNA U55 pseudouridine synthase TruB